MGKKKYELWGYWDDWVDQAFPLSAIDFTVGEYCGKPNKYARWTTHRGYENTVYRDEFDKRMSPLYRRVK